MAASEIISYYSGLLIIQYRSKPKAKATIEALVSPVVMDELPAKVQNAFNIETAIGKQLDVIGKYAGVVRSLTTSNSIITLSDSDFRSLIKIAVSLNHAGSSLADIQNIIKMFFAGHILVFDYQNMRMSYLIDTMVGTLALVQMFIRQNLLPKPMGVELASIIYLPVVNNVFGFGTYTPPIGGVNVHGFNTYSVYDLNAPWISYANAVL